MRTVCIDAHNLSLSKGSGIATYARELLQCVRAMGIGAHILHGPETRGSLDPLLNEISIQDARLTRRLPALRPNRRVQVALAGLGRNATRVDPSGKVAWAGGSPRPPADAFWLSPDLYRIGSRAFSERRRLTGVNFLGDPARRPDVMHWTYPAPLKARGMVNIYTVHDLIPLKLPYTTLDDKRRYLDLCRRIASQADHLVAVSETTKRDIIDYLGVSEDRITVTWQTTSLLSDLPARSDEVIACELEDSFGLNWKSYLVFFSAIEPKKNLRRLAEAYLRSGVKMPLIVVGRPAWLSEPDIGFLDEIAASPSAASQRIRRYDHLPRPLLIDLVRGARATLFPSLYEGFGLPALESMALGTPVMASTAGALPEVVADGGLLVDPYDVDEMARVIKSLASDNDLCTALAQRGRTRAEFFNANRYQDRLAALYRSLGVC